MSTYSVAQVENLTGIKAHTLRIWERRYGFLSPMRTDTNIRYYSDEQLKKLLNIGILTRHGYRISKIDKMSDEELNLIVSEILERPTDDSHDDIHALTICMLEFDEDKFEKIFNQQIMRRGLVTSLLDVIYPFLNHVGVLWGTNKAIPAQEHFISNLIRQKIIAAIENLPSPRPNAKRLVMFLLDGEDHEIGLLLGAYIAKEAGFRVYYLGQNVPSNNIDMIQDPINPDVLMTMFIAPSKERSQALLKHLKASTDLPILIAGSQFNLEDLESDDQVSIIETPYQFLGTLKEYL